MPCLDVYREEVAAGDVGGGLKTVTKAIGNNEERKGNHSMETQDFNVENSLQ
jgi:hypothetical protein